jgi:ATP-dependent Lhr-like helicase
MTTDDPLESFFGDRGWSAFRFQREVWDAYKAGESGLVHAATGTGKTLAAWLGPVREFLLEPKRPASQPEPLRVLWMTPLRALAQDTVDSLLAPVEVLGIPWSVERRTGDTSTGVKKRQRDRMPTALVSTPESVELLLSYPRTREQFAGLRLVVCDEWHELMGSKRGTMAELILARLRRWHPDLRVWGLSATIGNLDEALEALVGVGNPGRIVSGEVGKKTIMDSIIPSEVERLSRLRIEIATLDLTGDRVEAYFVLRGWEPFDKI